MKMTKKSNLIRVLRRELAQMPIAKDGAIDEEILSRLERIQRLAKLYEIATPQRRNPWPLAGAFFVTLIIASVLTFAHVGEIDIELDITTDTLAFELTDRQVFTGLLNLTTFTASGFDFRDTTVPGDLSNSEANRTTGGTIDLVAADSGKISLDALVLPGRTKVILGSLEHGYRFSFKGESFELPLTIQGPIRVSWNGGASKDRRDMMPSLLALRSVDGQTDLKLRFSEVKVDNIALQLHATDLSFERIEHFQVKNQVMVERLSTIRTGKIFNESIGGDAYTLRDGETLRFADSRGMVRRVELQNGTVRLLFHGSVQGMSTGRGETARSLMPSYLEWLNAQHGLSLLWGTSIYLFGLLGVRIRWWGGET
jgi:hypothetical protein